jgi:hypothetical protein
MERVQLNRTSVIEWWRTNRVSILSMGRHMRFPVEPNTAAEASEVSGRLCDWFDDHEPNHPRLYAGLVQVGTIWHVTIGIY